jgi:DNA-binding NarL/FixJ family response regulator
VAEAELRESIALLSGTPARLQLARSHHALGRILPTEQALPHLMAALELAYECGARGMRADIEAQLLAAGAEVPAQPDITTMTTTERKMATMAAAGDGVRDIAQALFVTPRTVEVTLDGVRTRLGLASDLELASVLAQHA